MIAKNIKAQSFAGCVRYVMKKDSELLKAEGVMAMSKEDMITSFELQRSVRPEIKSPVGHIPIAFAPEDRERMTNDFMTKLAEEYMQNMGIKDTQYIIVRHHDADNEHVHIIYNRIDNNGKLITDKNDYKRNIATCKKLKDKHNLTYGVNKFRVKREKLRGSERVKHDIYHAIREEIVYCHKVEELQTRLKSRGVEMEYKYRRGTAEVQGISFTKDNCTFKGSQIDRNFSQKGMVEIFQRIDVAWKEMEEKERQEQQKQKQQLPPKHNFKHPIPIKLGGVEITEQQRIALDCGKSVYMQGLTDKRGNVLNAYLKWSEQEDKLLYFRRDPDVSEQSQQQNQQPAQTHQPPPPQHEQSQNQQQSGSVISGGLGVFDLPTDSGDDDPEEAQFRNRMQQQQKKKRGRRM
ncbi:MAG: relaxase/mobilization nuclease domain-containing protein [Rikenellaceae bacterium]